MTKNTDLMRICLIAGCSGVAQACGTSRCVGWSYTSNDVWSVNNECGTTCVIDATPFNCMDQPSEVACLIAIANALEAATVDRNACFCLDAQSHSVAADFVLEADPCCETPTAAPTPDCFSSMATTNVETKGKTLISNLQVGDKVLTATGDYKPIYTFNHKNPNKMAKFVQIYSTANPEFPLEMTEAHMVFVDNKDSPIPALALKVGDALQTLNGDSSSIVTNISFIERKGVWNPITADGTIVVDGIIASTYNIGLGLNHGADVEVAGVKIMSRHDFVHLMMSPYRAVCLGLSLSFCESQNEYNAFSQIGNVIQKLRSNQSKVAQDLTTIAVVLFAFVLRFFSFVTNPLAVTGLALGIGTCCKRKSNKLQRECI